MTKPKPRDRIIEAAAELFYSEGIHAVGVDRLCEVAHVSKRSMYQHFASKDDVIAEMLKARGDGLLGVFVTDDAEGRSPRQRILHVFETLHAFAASEGFRGCPFVNVVTELKDSAHPGSVQAHSYKVRLSDHFENLARQGGARHPGVLGIQLRILFDGSCAYGVVEGGTPEAVVMAAGALMDAQGVA